MGSEAGFLLGILTHSQLMQLPQGEAINISTQNINNSYFYGRTARVSERSLQAAFVWQRTSKQMYLINLDASQLHTSAT